MTCDRCFENQCLEAEDRSLQKAKINYITELKNTVECGDNIVEYDKGEECDGVLEGCNPKTCQALPGYICFSPVLGNSRCLKCHDPIAENLCKALYLASDKTFEEMKILSKCVSKCEYAEGSYPINGFIRSCWGKQTYKNEEG